jgi:hypothetical protein
MECEGQYHCLYSKTFYNLIGVSDNLILHATTPGRQPEVGNQRLQSWRQQVVGRETNAKI